MAVYVVVGVFIILDIVTGILEALYKGEMNSTKLRKGLYHKLSEVIAVGCSGLYEYGTQYFDFGFDLPVLKAVAAYICLMEFVSISENLAQTNPTLRKLFAPYLGKLKGDEKESEREEAY